MIINRIYETQILGSLSFWACGGGLRSYHHPCTGPSIKDSFNVLLVTSVSNTVTVKAQSEQTLAKYKLNLACVTFMGTWQFKSTRDLWTQFWIILSYILLNESRKIILQCGHTEETIIQGLLKKSYNTCYTSLKINRKHLPFFLWLIRSILLATIVPLNNTFSHVCAGNHQNGVVWLCMF
jgi:hypothetical protein